jgi:hypothetical protein
MNWSFKTIGLPPQIFRDIVSRFWFFSSIITLTWKLIHSFKTKNFAEIYSVAENINKLRWTANNSTQSKNPVPIYIKVLGISTIACLRLFVSSEKPSLSRYEVTRVILKQSDNSFGELQKITMQTSPWRQMLCARKCATWHRTKWWIFVGPDK